MENLITLSINWNLGISLTILGYSIVLLSLTFLFGVYTLIPKIINWSNSRNLRRQGRHECAEKESLGLSGEVSAAISMALYYYLNELHDIESGKITIKKISKRYTPWSSKIYSMNSYKK